MEQSTQRSTQDARGRWETSQLPGAGVVSIIGRSSQHRAVYTMDYTGGTDRENLSAEAASAVMHTITLPGGVGVGGGWWWCGESILGLKPINELTAGKGTPITRRYDNPVGH